MNFANLIPGSTSITLKNSRHEYGDVYTFIFESENTFSFRAGQHVHMALAGLPIGKEAVRELSIGSSPSDSEIWFTVHVRPHSRFKMKLASLKVGERVTLFKVGGAFVLPDTKNIPLIFIAGGIGITPIRALLREIAFRHEEDRTVVLVHVGTNDFLFKNELEEMRTITQYRIGRPDINTTLMSVIQTYHEGLYYLSGTPSFVQHLSGKLREHGIIDEQIRLDTFKGYENE